MRRIVLMRRKNKLKKLELYLAREPGGDFLKEINGWVKESFGEDVVLKITVDGSILGGAVVIYEGKYFDGSLRKKIMEMEGVIK